MSLTLGLLLGFVWFHMDDGDYHSRMGLLAASYCALCFLIIDAVEGIWQRQDAFLRETSVHTTSLLAHTLSDSSPSLLLLSLGCSLFSLPLYTLSGLKPSLQSYSTFNLLLLLSLYLNLHMAYLLCALSASPLQAKMAYAGVVLPLQLLLSGYLFLPPTLPPPLHLLCSLSPMRYFLMGAFHAEFGGSGGSGGGGNSRALGGVSYEELANMYDFHVMPVLCVCVLLLMGFVLKLLFMACLALKTHNQGQGLIGQGIGGLGRGPSHTHTHTRAPLSGSASRSAASTSDEFGAAFRVP
ncbi:hypothetical protein B484DRAFT_417372 [Ochromonadaceae sp. CCMP2298]|nr:hypothetical protein B484DRAFT_417372 [Ochromonadaceae sp. CCMP2298]